MTDAGITRLIQRQLRRAFGHTETPLDDLLQQARAEGGAGAVLAEGVIALLGAVESSYRQYARDLELRTRSLDLSSRELYQANQELREKTGQQSKALDILTVSANELLTAAGLARLQENHNDLVGLAEAMAKLVMRDDEAKNQAQQQRDRLESVLDSVDQGYWDWNVTTGKVFYSQKCYRLLNLPVIASEAGFDLLLSSVASTERMRFVSLFDAHIEGQSRSIEFDFPLMPEGKAGETIIQIRGRAIAWDGNGRASRLVGSLADVTVQRHAERAVQQHLEMVEELIEGIPVAIFLKTPDGRYASVNGAFEKLFGVERGGIVGKKIDEVAWHPQQRERCAGLMHKDAQLPVYGQPMIYEEVVHSVGGKRYDVINHKRMLKRRDGTSIGILGAVVDITKQKRTEDALRVAQRELKQELAFSEQLLDALPVAAYFKGVDGRYVRVNAAFEQLTGVMRGNVLGTTVENGGWHSSSKGTLDEHRLADSKLYRDGTSQTYESAVINASGQHIDVVSYKSLLRSTEGVPLGVIGVMVDVSRQKEVENQLETARRELEDQLYFSNELIEVIPNPIYYKDRSGRYLGFNRAWEQFYGRRRELWIGKTALEQIGGELGQEIYALDDDLLRTGDNQVHNRKIEASGKMREVVFSKALFRNSLGEPAGIIGVITDISAQKEAESALLQAKDAAESASRAKSDFLANMSHEIRTPMNAIIGMTDLTLETRLSDEQREYLGLVNTSAKSLLTIINDILDFSKVESGQFTVEAVAFDLRRVVSEVKALFDQRAQEKVLLLTWQYADNVPQWVVGDPVRLRQILVNLVGNAIKFTQVGGVALSVSVADNQQLEFVLEDTGIGIDPDKLHLIFEAFQQADTSTTRKFGGTGLGLTISRRLAVLMGGGLEARSERGFGSTFTLTLPLPGTQPPVEAQGELEEQATRLTRESSWIVGSDLPGAQKRALFVAPEWSGNTRSLRVLLAEDNRVNQRLARILLEKMGHSVEVAENGREAVERFRLGAFDVVLMDLQMPVMGGLDAVAEIRALELTTGSHIPIIAVTAHAMQGDEERCLLAGMDDYLSKPIDKNELATKLATIAEKLTMSISERA